MTPTFFKDQAAKADDESEIDALCILWLRDALDDNGSDGHIGIELLKIIEKRCMP